MNTNAKLLIERLKTTEVPQGKGFLNRNGRYCCLGIACELAIELGLVVEKLRDDIRPIFLYDSKGTTLPGSVRNFFGFKNQSGSYSYKDSLVADNDSGKTFKEIAVIIEKNAESLFQED